MSTYSIVFAFFLIILPFVLWRLSMVGRSQISSKRSCFPPNYVPPGPTPTWISIASTIQAVQSTYGAAIQTSIASSLPKHHATPDSMIVQSRLVHFASLHVARTIEHGDSKYIGVDIDYDHINAITLTLSSNEETSQFLGYPRPVRHEGTEPPLAINCKADCSGDAHIFAVRISKWCSRGIIFINGLRVDTLIVEDGFSGELHITNSWN